MKSRLKELRARHGWNQSELARRANISRQTISLIEREEFMPSLYRYVCLQSYQLVKV